MQTRRERIKQETIEEIKSLSWETIRDQGVEKLSINGLARQMGMTPPAFYTYFKNRDDLILTLVKDAYDSFAASLEKTVMPGKPPGENLLAVFIAYREWAVKNPNMFGLFAGRIVSGFDPPDPEISKAALRIYAVFHTLYNEAWETGLLKEFQGPDLPRDYKSQLAAFAKEFGLSLPALLVEQVMRIACSVHGSISIELSGRFSKTVTDPALVYRWQVISQLRQIGLEAGPP